MKVTLSGNRLVNIKIDYEPVDIYVARFQEEVSKAETHKDFEQIKGRTTSVMVEFLNEKLEPICSMFGDSYCNPADNFCKIKGKAYALQHLFQHDPSYNFFKYEDRQLLYKTLCRSYFLPKNYKLINELQSIKQLVDEIPLAADKPDAIIPVQKTLNKLNALVRKLS